RAVPFGAHLGQHGGHRIVHVDAWVGRARQGLAERRHAAAQVEDAQGHGRPKATGGVRAALTWGCDFTGWLAGRDEARDGPSLTPCLPPPNSPPSPPASRTSTTG